MARRHDDALYIINPGACNPSGVAHAIIRACQDIRAQPNTGTTTIREDPAVRLMVYQLAFLCNAGEFDHDLGAYDKALKLCEELAKVEGPAKEGAAG
jgi:hypothetical protein